MAVAGLISAVGSLLAVDPPRRCLSVQGVTLGTVKEEVLASLGKPARAQTGYDAEMGEGRLLTLVYPGLVVELNQPEGQDDLAVSEIRVTSKRWVLEPQLRVGMTKDQVIGVLGTAGAEEDRSGGKARLFYPDLFHSTCGDVQMWIDLKSGKVTEIGIASDWS